MDWCEANGVDFIFGLAGNAALHALACEAADDVRVRRAETRADKVRGFAAIDYAARSWRRKRRIANPALARGHENIAERNCLVQGRGERCRTDT